MQCLVCHCSGIVGGMNASQLQQVLTVAAVIAPMLQTGLLNPSAPQMPNAMPTLNQATSNPYAMGQQQQQSNQMQSVTSMSSVQNTGIHYIIILFIYLYFILCKSRT